VRCRSCGQRFCRVLLLYQPGPQEDG
jgi:hypothetical protein